MYLNRLTTPIAVANLVNIAYRMYARPLKVTRVQLFYLDYLIRMGHTGIFHTCNVIPDNQTRQNTNQLLVFFVQNGIAEKLKPGTWQLLPLAFELHSKVSKEIETRLHSPFRWK
jgi:hypothetical protein